MRCKATSRRTVSELASGPKDTSQCRFASWTSTFPFIVAISYQFGPLFENTETTSSTSIPTQSFPRSTENTVLSLYLTSTTKFRSLCLKLLRLLLSQDTVSE